MPHLTFEYSRNVGERIDIQALCDTLLEVAVETGVFPLGGIRVRAICCDEYSIADKHRDNGFIDLSVRIGEGRDLATKKIAGQTIFDKMCDFLASEFDRPHFALSLEIREINKELSWKKNSMHARLS